MKSLFVTVAEAIFENHLSGTEYDAQYSIIVSRLCGFVKYFVRISLSSTVWYQQLFVAHMDVAFFREIHAPQLNGRSPKTADTTWFLAQRIARSRPSRVNHEIPRLNGRDRHSKPFVFNIFPDCPKQCATH
jgi:hypothetical protein